MAQAQEPVDPAVPPAAARRSRADEVYGQLKRDVAEFKLGLGRPLHRERVVRAPGRLAHAGALLDKLTAFWLVPVAERSADTVQAEQWDEAFHWALVAAAGNGEMARAHREVADRIRIIHRLDLTKQARIDATYDEYGKILRAIQRKRGEQAGLLLRAHIATSQAEERKITLHQVHLVRTGGLTGRQSGKERSVSGRAVVRTATPGAPASPHPARA